MTTQPLPAWGPDCEQDTIEGDIMFNSGDTGQLAFEDTETLDFTE